MKASFIYFNNQQREINSAEVIIPKYDLNGQTLFMSKT